MPKKTKDKEEKLIKLEEGLEDFNIMPPPKEMARRDEILSRAYKDLIFFGRAFLPRDFLRKSTTPDCHYGISKKLISTRAGQRICIILPRGFGKSILCKSAIMHKLCFRLKIPRIL